MTDTTGAVVPTPRRPDAPTMGDLRTALENLHGELLADARTFAGLATTAATCEGRCEAERRRALSVARAGYIAKQLRWVA